MAAILNVRSVTIVEDQRNSYVVGGQGSISEYVERVSKGGQENVSYRRLLKLFKLMARLERPRK